MLSEPSPASARDSFLTIALCYLVAVFEGLDLQAAGVAAPKLGPAFHMNPDQLGVFFSSSTFGLILGAAIGGRLSDRFGRKRVLITAVSVFGLMSVATGLTQGIPALLIARFLTGLGIGGALPTLVSLVSENAQAEQRNTAVGILYAGLPSGGALASLIAALTTSDSWSAVFLLGGIAPLIAVPLLAFTLPESAQLQAAKTAAATTEPLQRSGFLYALFGKGRGAFTLPLWASFFLALLTMYLLLNWLPTLLVGRGMSRPDASLVQLAFNVLGAVSSVVTGRMMDRMAFRTVILASFASAGISLVLLAHVRPELMWALAAGGLVGITMSATQALMYALAPIVYETQIRGTGIGSAVAAGRIGSAVGPLLAGALLASGRQPEQVLQILAPIMLVAGGLVLLLLELLDRRRITE